MENFSVTKTDQGFHIEGFPDAVKVIRLEGPKARRPEGPKARRLADLALHKADLEFAVEYLDAINEAPPHPSPVRQALWLAAIVRLFKCFLKNEARFTLKAEEVYADDEQGQEVFEYFRALRSKHLVHDENSYTQCIPGAVLNKEESEYKIAKIVCFSATAETLDEDGYSNLYLLCDRARLCVQKQFDALSDELTAALGEQAYSDLHRRKGIVYRKPKVEEIRIRRTTP